MPHRSDRAGAGRARAPRAAPSPPDAPLDAADVIRTFVNLIGAQAPPLRPARSRGTRARPA